jgi:hypothetical protein
MKAGSMKLALSFASLFLAFIVLFNDGLSTCVQSQTTFIQPTPNRNQRQNQQSLPPEKKKSLSNIGPEDVFPTERDRDGAERTGNRPPARTATAPKPSTKSSPHPLPATTPSPLTANIATGTTKASPTATVSVTALTQQGQQRHQREQQSNIEWVLFSLAILSFFVFTALIYVVFKLMEKLREGNS